MMKQMMKEEEEGRRDVDGRQLPEKKEKKKRRNKFKKKRAASKFEERASLRRFFFVNLLFQQLPGQFAVAPARPPPGGVSRPFFTEFWRTEFRNRAVSWHNIKLNPIKRVQTVSNSFHVQHENQRYGRINKKKLGKN